jgi:EmrB/QacA subfamily drug resistance transporter
MQTRSIERWTLIAAIFASSMAFIDSTALSIVQLNLQNDFRADYNLVAWVVNGYNLALAALILVGGSLGDIYGRKRIFIIGIIIFAITSIACGLAPTIELLILARIAQGIGGALMIPGSLALITAVFPPEKRGAAIGLWSMFSSLMVIVGPVIGGQLAALDFWRGVFFINIPFALIALYGLRAVPESRDPAGTHLDLPGAILAVVGLAGLTYGFTEAPAQGFDSPTVWIALIVGIVALIAFVVVEIRSPYPMMPLRLFASRTFAGANLLTLFLYAGLALVTVFLPLNLLRVQAYPEAAVSVAMLPLAFALIIMSRIMGGLVTRIGARPMLIVGPALAAVGFFLFGVPGVTRGVDDYWTTIFPAALALGIGMGITVVPLTTAVMNAAPTASSGAASGINNAVSRVAGVLAIAVFSALAVSVFGNALHARAADLGLAESQRVTLVAEAPKLADAAVPSNIGDAQVRAVDDAIRASFADTFRMIAWGAAGLAALSALAAALLVERRA